MYSIGKYKFSKNIYYHKSHSWVHLRNDGLAMIGVDDFYQHEVGNINGIILPSVGENVYQDKICARIFSTNWMNKFCSPIDGQIMTVNESLINSPDILNSDPYNNGWIALVKSTSFEFDLSLNNLTQGYDIQTWIEQEIEEVEREKSACPICKFEMQASAFSENDEEQYWFCPYCFSYSHGIHKSKFCISNKRYSRKQK
jgi:glycine cleavage system H protein